MRPLGGGNIGRAYTAISGGSDLAFPQLTPAASSLEVSWNWGLTSRAKEGVTLRNGNQGVVPSLASSRNRQPLLPQWT